jgi:dolichol-phosphate mannosyltransferase
MRKLISFVLPVYNESEGIAVFYRELSRVTAKLKDKYNFEYWFINDGSRDNSLEELLKLHKKDKQVKVINFARNFGHQMAVTAGLDHVQGDAVIIMDTDLQDPPRVCLELIKEWENGIQVAYAQRRSRKDTFLKKLTANYYYKLLNRISEVRIPRNVGDFRLMDRKVVNVLRKFPEKNRYLRGLVTFVGFKQKAVVFDRDARFAGKSGYTWGKMIKLAIDGITSFSVFPLHFVFQFGILLTLISLLALAVSAVTKLTGQPVNNLVFIFEAIFLSSGLQITMLGLIAQYTGRIYREAQDRPLYIIDEVYA